MRFRRTSFLVKLMLLALSASAIAALISLQTQIQQVNAENVEKEQQLTYLTQTNEKLKSVNDDMAEYRSAFNQAQAEYGEYADEAEIIAGIDSDAMTAAAREQGYVNPGEVIFEDINH